MCEIETIPDSLLRVAASTLANLVSDEQLNMGLFPPLHQLRSLSVQIAVKVCEEAYSLGLAKLVPQPVDLFLYLTSCQFCPHCCGDLKP